MPEKVLIGKLMLNRGTVAGLEESIFWVTERWCIPLYMPRPNANLQINVPVNVQVLDSRYYQPLVEISYTSMCYTVGT